MVLTDFNINEWINELDLQMEKQHRIKHYSTCNDSFSWHVDFIGQTVQDVIDDDMFYSSQN